MIIPLNLEPARVYKSQASSSFESPPPNNFEKKPPFELSSLSASARSCSAFEDISRMLETFRNNYLKLLNTCVFALWRDV